MTSPLPWRRWVNRALCAVALLSCAGGAATCVWLLRLERSSPAPRDPLLNPEALRSILETPDGFVSVIGFERDATRHLYASGGFFLHGLWQLVLLQLPILLLVWLTLPPDWALPRSRLPGRFQAWLGRRRSATRLPAAPAPPTQRALRWSGRQVARAAVLLAAAAALLAWLGSRIAWHAAALAQHAAAAANAATPPDGDHVLAALIDGVAHWRWAQLAVALPIALFLGLQLLTAALLLPLLRRGGGVVTGGIDGTSPGRPAAWRPANGVRRPLRPLFPALLRTGGQIGLLLLLVAAALLVGDWGLEPVLHARARGRLESRIGPLTASRFRSRPASEAAHAAAIDLVSAAAAVRVVGSEGGLLRRALERSSPAAPLPDGVRAVLARNAVVLRVVENLGSGPIPALAADYAATQGKLPFGGFDQLVLSRLLYLRGAAAAADGDPRRYEAALRALGIQAAMLEREPGVEPLTLGMLAEKYQLKLLEILLERGAVLGTSAWRAVDVDLGQSYVEVTALHAWLLEQQLPAAMADPAGGPAPNPLPLDVRVIRRLAPRLLGAPGRRTMAHASFASGLDWTGTFAAAYSKPFATMHRELEPRVAGLTFRDQVGYMLAPRGADLAAQLRLLAEARELARCALDLRLRAPAAAACRVAAAPFVDSRSIAGGCLLRSRDAEEAVQLFEVRHPPPLAWIVPLRAARSDR
jgi:hypothetical protein